MMSKTQQEKTYLAIEISKKPTGNAVIELLLPPARSSSRMPCARRLNGTSGSGEFNHGQSVQCQDPSWMNMSHWCPFNFIFIPTSLERFCTSWSGSSAGLHRFNSTRQVTGKGIRRSQPRPRDAPVLGFTSRSERIPKVVHGWDGDDWNLLSLLSLWMFFLTSGCWAMLGNVGHICAPNKNGLVDSCRF